MTVVGVIGSKYFFYFILFFQILLVYYLFLKCFDFKKVFISRSWVQKTMVKSKLSIFLDIHEIFH